MYPYEGWADANLRIKSKNEAEANVWCFSPDHDESRPSCYFNMDKGTWICFSCGYTGALNSSDIDEYDIKPKEIRTRLNRLVNVNEDEKRNVVPESMLVRYNVKHSYWNERNISSEVQELFELGYDATAHAVTIPLRDLEGHLIGVTRRFLDPNHIGSRYKYPYKFKASQNVFASWLFEEYDFDTVCITEGSIDAMRLWTCGIPAVAVYGAMVSAEHINILLKTGTRKVIYFGDGDDAGKRAKQRSRGYWIRADGSYQYKSSTDFSRHFALYHVPSHFGKKDAGEMSDKEIVAAVKNAELYRFRPETKMNKPSSYERIKSKLKRYNY